MPAPETPRVALVMPVANERETIARAYRAIVALPVPGLIWVPVVDSVSTDGTAPWLMRIARTDPRVRPVDLGPARGLARAYLEGFRHALAFGAEKIIEIDAGGSHPAGLVPLFVRKLDEFPIVFATRLAHGGRIEGMPLSRRCLSRAGTLAARLVLGLPFTDCTSGFQGFRREVLLALDLDRFASRFHVYQTEMKFYCRRLPFAEVPLRYRGSASTLKRASLSDAGRVFRRMLAERLGLNGLPQRTLDPARVRRIEIPFPERDDASAAVEPIAVDAYDEPRSRPEDTSIGL
jgi:glycosyltransferase involved in cell wall biosynthesis